MNPNEVHRFAVRADRATERINHWGRPKSLYPDTLPDRTGKRDWTGVAAQLRDRAETPGEHGEDWGVVSTGEKSDALAKTIRAGKGAFRPTPSRPGRYLATAEKVAGEGVTVWARFLPEGKRLPNQGSPADGRKKQ